MVGRLVSWSHGCSIDVHYIGRKFSFLDMPTLFLTEYPFPPLLLPSFAYFHCYTTWGDDDRFNRTVRALEQSSERMQREMEIRSDLRRWDNDYPELHHELIVRWVAGAIVSVAISSLYNSLKPQPPRYRKY